MEINEITQDLIEQFLQGKLGGKALSDFESRLQNEADFAKEVALYRTMNEAFADREIIQLEQKLEVIGNQATQAYEAKQVKSVRKPAAKIRRLSMWKVSAIAASFLFLVVATWFLTRSASTDELFADNYSPFTETIQVRSGAAEAATALENGIVTYQKGDYAASLAIFEELANNPDDLGQNASTLALYTGLSYLGQENNTDALTAFQQVTTAAPSLATQAAHWYTALVHLQAGRVGECKTSLEAVLAYSEKGRLAKQAKELLERL